MPSGGQVSLHSLIAKGVRKPQRDHLLLYAVSGWGKTSIASYATKPLFLLSKGELGLLTLMQNQQIPEVNYLQFPREGDLKPDAHSWEEVTAILKRLIKEAKDLDFKTLVIDTLNGLEKLCFDYVCRTKFANDWGEQGFMGYQRGFDVAVPEWDAFFELLNKLREQGIGIISLCHDGIGKVPNPSGPDYTKYAPDMHAKIWNLTKGKVDVILFGKYRTETVSQDVKKKTKAKGGKERIIHTTQEASIDAKNRHGLPPTIDVSNTSAEEAWADLMHAFTSKE